MPEHKRPGRRPGPPDQRRTERLPVMLTQAEYAALEERAQRLGASMAELLREAARDAGYLTARADGVGEE